MHALHISYVHIPRYMGFVHDMYTQCMMLADSVMKLFTRVTFFFGMYAFHGMLPGALESKTTNRYPTYPLLAIATATAIATAIAIAIAIATTIASTIVIPQVQVTP